jgi:hypothetical protein
MHISPLFSNSYTQHLNSEDQTEESFSAGTKRGLDVSLVPSQETILQKRARHEPKDWIFLSSKDVHKLRRGRDEKRICQILNELDFFMDNIPKKLSDAFLQNFHPVLKKIPDWRIRREFFCLAADRYKPVASGNLKATLSKVASAVEPVLFREKKGICITVAKMFFTEPLEGLESLSLSYQILTSHLRNDRLRLEVIEILQSLPIQKRDDYATFFLEFPEDFKEDPSLFVPFIHELEFEDFNHLLKGSSKNSRRAFLATELKKPEIRGLELLLSSPQETVERYHAWFDAFSQPRYRYDSYFFLMVADVIKNLDYFEANTKTYKKHSEKFICYVRHISRLSFDYRMMQGLHLTTDILEKRGPFWQPLFDFLKLYEKNSSSQLNEPFLHDLEILAQDLVEEVITSGDEDLLESILSLQETLRFYRRPHTSCPVKISSKYPGLADLKRDGFSLMSSSSSLILSADTPISFPKKLLDLLLFERVFEIPSFQIKFLSLPTSSILDEVDIPITIDQGGPKRQCIDLLTRSLFNPHSNHFQLDSAEMFILKKDQDLLAKDYLQLGLWIRLHQELGLSLAVELPPLFPFYLKHAPQFGRALTRENLMKLDIAIYGPRLVNKTNLSIIEKKQLKKELLIDEDLLAEEIQEEFLKEVHQDRCLAIHEIRRGLGPNFMFEVRKQSPEKTRRYIQGESISAASLLKKIRFADELESDDEIRVYNELHEYFIEKIKSFNKDQLEGFVSAITGSKFLSQGDEIQVYILPEEGLRHIKGEVRPLYKSSTCTKKLFLYTHTIEQLDLALTALIDDTKFNEA